MLEWKHINCTGNHKGKKSKVYWSGHGRLYLMWEHFSQDLEGKFKQWGIQLEGTEWMHENTLAGVHLSYYNHCS